MSRLEAQRTWLLYQGVGALALAVGWTVAPIYFVRDVGMSPLELILAGTALELAYFLFEVPTGAVADLFSRRASIVVAQVIMGAGFVLTGAVDSVGVILAAAAIMGFGWTFKSGAEDAWLAEELGAEALGPAYQRGAQVARVCGLAGIGIAVGLALVDLQLPVVVGGVLLVALGLLLAFVMPERGFRPAPRSELGVAGAVGRTARDGGRLIRARPALLLIIGITFCGGMSSEAMDRLWEAHFLRDVGVPSLAGLDQVVWFGALNAGVVLLAIVFAQPLMRRLAGLEREGMARTLLGLDSAVIAALVVFALADAFALAVAAFWAVGIARSLAAPVHSAWVNANVDDARVRATVISIVHLGDSVGEFGGGPALGVVGNAFGIRAALAAGAAALSPALWLYGRAIRHHGREAELERLPGAAGA